jgi:hypothetical protein
VIHPGLAGFETEDVMLKKKSWFSDGECRNGPARLVQAENSHYRWFE